MNRIEWTPKAARQLRKFVPDVQRQVYDGVGELVHWPQVKNVKKLQNRNDYRLRIGNHRVIFTVHPDGSVTVILIEEVKKRDEHTY